MLWRRWSAMNGLSSQIFPQFCNGFVLWVLARDKAFMASSAVSELCKKQHAAAKVELWNVEDVANHHRQ
jgi:hypothetical protein